MAVRRLRQKLGRIEPGDVADLTVLHTRNMFHAPKDQLAGQIVHSELGGRWIQLLLAARS